MRWSRAVLLSLFTAFGFVACSSGGGGGAFDGGVAPIGSNVPRDAEIRSDAKRDSRGDVEEEEDADVGEDAAFDAKKPDGAFNETGAKICPSVCNTDFECQQMCPAAPLGGVNCCDTATGVCYATSSGSCGGADGGFD